MREVIVEIKHGEEFSWFDYWVTGVPDADATFEVSIPSYGRDEEPVVYCIERKSGDVFNAKCEKVGETTYRFTIPDKSERTKGGNIKAGPWPTDIEITREGQRTEVGLSFGLLRGEEIDEDEEEDED